MAGLMMQKIQHDPATRAFDCGVEGINQMIRKSYYPTLLQHLYAYEISVKGTIVGYYMLGFRRIELSSLPDDIGDYMSDMSEYCYALHLRYIAVDLKYQGRKIGRNALMLIIGQAIELSNSWPIRLITLDALPERVEWYEKLGFAPIKKDYAKNEKGEVPMYLECLQNRGLLEEYCSGIG